MYIKYISDVFRVGRNNLNVGVNHQCIESETVAVTGTLKCLRRKSSVILSLIILNFVGYHANKLIPVTLRCFWEQLERQLL